ncbi:hypothetical protein ACK2M7_13695 [Chryseobacterium sp. TY4]
MRSRLLKTLLTILAPIVIDYVVKKVLQKKTQPTDKALQQS